MHAAHLRNSALMTVLAGCVAIQASAAEQTDIGVADKGRLEKTFPSKPNYSPYAGRSFPTLPLFGDTHLHTSFSMMQGRLGRVSHPTTLTDSPGARRSPPTPVNR